jgi:hypothetical protein
MLHARASACSSSWQASMRSRCSVPFLLPSLNRYSKTPAFGYAVATKLGPAIIRWKAVSHRAQICPNYERSGIAEVIGGRNFAFANDGNESLRRVGGFEAVSNQPSKSFSDKPAHVCGARTSIHRDDARFSVRRYVRSYSVNQGHLSLNILFPRAASRRSPKGTSQ